MYQPAIKEELICRMYKLGKRLKKPMTQVVNQLLEESLAYYEMEYQLEVQDGEDAARSAHHHLRHSV